MELREVVDIKEVQPGRLLLTDGSSQAFDECLWCTQASAPPWLSTTGLQLGQRPAAPAAVLCYTYARTLMHFCNSPVLQ